jgi:hypothetical protein
MENKPLTKSQRRRANERNRKKVAKLYSPPSGQIAMADDPKRFLEANSNLLPRDPEDIEPFERAPPHTLEFSEDFIGVSSEKVRGLARTAGARRTAEREQQISDLKARYPQWWGRRSGAKNIASLEAEAGNGPFSERTIQKYFKMKKK